MPRLVVAAKRLVLYLGVAVLGFVAGALLLYVLWVRSGPQVEPWHVIELTEEFTAKRADEIDSFAKYLELEDRLFDEMDVEVYADTPTGPDYALVRYSAGSASDPRRRQPNWNRSFELVPENPIGGVLLLHGMSDGPYSLRALGQALAEKGYRVLGLRLPGHGTIPAGLRTLTWEDLAAAARMGMRHLSDALAADSDPPSSDQDSALPIHIIGYSTGGALALDYTLNTLAGSEAPLPASLVLVSPAIGITPAAALSPWLDRFSVLPGLDQLAWTSLLPEFDPFNYNSFSTNASVQVHRMTRSNTARVRRMAAGGPIANFPPTLVLLTAVDATVSPNAVADQLLSHLPPNRHEFLIYDINRFALKSPLLVSDPAPLVDRLMLDDKLPFAVTLVTNESTVSRNVVARYKPPFSAATARIDPLRVAWPEDVISLSHVDLPFPPDDPLYGLHPPETGGEVFLGQLAIRGERGLLKLPASWLLRLRHNPFYDYQERRVLDWIDNASRTRKGATID